MAYEVVELDNLQAGDDVTVDNIGAGTSFVQPVKVAYGAEGTFTEVTSTAPLPVDLPDATGLQQILYYRQAGRSSPYRSALREDGEKSRRPPERTAHVPDGDG